MPRAAVIAVACAALTTACGQDLAFRVDHRVKIVSPTDRSTVRLPLELRWATRDLVDITFAVFVDRSPLPAGRPLASLAGSDRSCRSTPGCPDAAYLARLGVYTTGDTHLTVPTVTKRAIGSQRDRHTATIVLIDQRSRRVGESTFYVTFEVAGEPPA